jgi:hypothetical protein
MGTRKESVDVSSGQGWSFGTAGGFTPDSLWGNPFQPQLAEARHLKDSSRGQRKKRLAEDCDGLIMINLGWPYYAHLIIRAALLLGWSLSETTSARYE